MEQHLEIELDLPITDEMREQHADLVGKGVETYQAWRIVAESKVPGGIVQMATPMKS